jgi:hypothetical protein
MIKKAERVTPRTEESARIAHAPHSRRYGRKLLQAARFRPADVAMQEQTPALFDGVAEPGDSGPTSPALCPRCGRQIRHLFCTACAMAQLDDTAIVAHAREIRALSRRPVQKPRALTECLFCSETIAVGSNARLLASGAYAHLDCVRGLRARLNEIMPRQEPVVACELRFDGSISVE